MRLSPRCGAREKMKDEGCSSNSWESYAIFSGSLKATSGPCKARGVGLRHFTKPNSSSVSLLQKRKNSGCFISIG